MTRSHDFLAVESIDASYGQAGPALRGVSLTVAEGSIVALLGSNGAGKSTTLRAISNLLGPQRGALRGGSIRWRGESTAGLDPADLVRRGIVQVLEGRHVFGQLTVEENLRTGGFLRRPSRRQLADDLERVYAWFPRLRDRRSAKAGLTSGGRRAADGGDRPGADDPPDPGPPRRAVDGARADHRRRDLRDHPSPQP